MVQYVRVCLRCTTRIRLADQLVHVFTLQHLNNNCHHSLHLPHQLPHLVSPLASSLDPSPILSHHSLHPAHRHLIPRSTPSSAPPPHPRVAPTLLILLPPAAHQPHQLQPSRSSRHVSSVDGGLPNKIRCDSSNTQVERGCRARRSTEDGSLERALWEEEEEERR